jgi:MFS family permease
MSGTVARARKALDSRDFRLLLSLKMLSQFADGVFQAFLIDRVVFLNTDKGTAAAVAKAFAILVVPFSLIGPLTGVVIDRWSRRAILVFTPLVRAVAVVLLLTVTRRGTSWELYALTLVIVSLNRFFLSTGGAVVPRLVPDEDLLVGNALSSVSGTVLGFVGILAGTQLAHPIGTRGLLILVAVCYPVASLLARRIGDPLRPQRPDVGFAAHLRQTTGEAVRGARRLFATPQALAPVVSVALDQFLIGIVTVLSVVVFKNQFQQGVASYGRIVAAGGVGILAGASTVGLLEERLAKARIIAISFAASGLVCLLVAPIIVGPTILLVSFVLGLTYPWRKVPSDTLVQESIPDRYRGRVFALYDVFFALPRVIAAAIAIPLIPAMSSGWILAICGALYVLWAPVPPRWIPRPMRVGVRFYAGGRADEVPRALIIAGEEELVEVVRSSTEETVGAQGFSRRRRFLVRTPDGAEVDLAEDAAGWRVEPRMAPHRAAPLPDA